MPLLRVAALLELKRELFLDRMVSAVQGNVPRYELLPAADFRASLDGLLQALISLLKGADRLLVQERLMVAADRRIAQGFTAADYLRAVFVVPSVLQAELRIQAAHDGETVAELELLAPIMLDLTAGAGNTFVDRMGRQLHAKNIELNRMNQQLAAQQRSLSLEVDQALRQLSVASELNSRVIESLSSGVFVTDRASMRISLFSSRLEEIIGIPCELAIGQPVNEVFAAIHGLDASALIQQVKQTGSMPLTKLHVVMPNGRKKSVYVRAQSLLDESGEPSGTVVIVDDVSERELLLDSFSRYVSRDLVKRLLARAEPLGLEGERRSCTILFADVRGFTTLAEGQSPEEVHLLLNVYFRLMIDAILSAGGFIDKFVGDKVMALFTDGDPVDHARAALVAASNIKLALATLNSARREGGLQAMEIGVGVNTGEVLLGNIGSDQRMEFTAIGDPVNVADRLQHLARLGEVLVGEGTARLVGDEFPLVDRGQLSIRGRQATAHVFELADPRFAHVGDTSTYPSIGADGLVIETTLTDAD